MFFTPWLAPLKQFLPSQRRSRLAFKQLRRPQRRAFQVLGIGEVLEDRTLLATGLGNGILTDYVDRDDNSPTSDLPQSDESSFAPMVDLPGMKLPDSSANRFDGESLKELVSNTIASARASTPDEFNCFADPHAQTDQDLRILDERIETTPIEEKIERAFLLESAARSVDPRITRSAYIVYEDGTAHHSILNTLGVSSECRSSFCAGVSWVGAVEGDQVQTGLIESASTQYAGLDCKKVAEYAGDFTERT